MSKSVEDYRNGYPQFSTIIGACAPFHISRRFSRLRSRLFLVKQDHLSVLEKRLDDVDQEETRDLYLGCQRRDKNPERKQILDKIADALKDYDELVQRNHRMLSYDSPQPMNIASLRNWIESRGSLASDEVAYLDSGNDLLCVATHADSFLERLELLVEKLAIWSSEYIGKRAKSNVSRSPDVYIFSGTALKRLAQALAAWGVVLLLLLPVIILSVLQSMSLRLVLVVLAAAMAIMLFAMMSHTSTRDLFLAGATYSAVLVVFVAGTGLSSQ
ncbi:hypothetical protein MAN_10744, partial [Metarhizium hybridum]